MLFLKKSCVYSLLLAAFALAGVFVFLALAQTDGDPQALQWRSFDVKEIEQSLDEGKLVLVFGNPLYHLEGKALKGFFAAPDVANAIGNTNAVLFYLEYDGWYDDDVDDLFRLTRKIKEPIVVFLKKGQQARYFDAGGRNELLTFISSIK